VAGDTAAVADCSYGDVGIVTVEEAPAESASVEEPDCMASVHGVSLAAVEQAGRVVEVAVLRWAVVLETGLQLSVREAAR
jgi:hypothetical protein